MTDSHPASRPVRTRSLLMTLASAMLAGVLVVCALAAGCGDAAPEQTGFVATSLPDVATIPAPASAGESTQTTSLHERIMAEHRLAEALTAGRPTSTTAISGAPAARDTTPPAAAPAAAGAGFTTNAVLSDGQTPLQGVWDGTAEQLASYLVGVEPSTRFTVSPVELAGYYVRYSAEAGLRADLLWAQMIHETGYGKYGGAVSPEQNNYAGIGATGGGEPGIRFPSAEAGVMAQVAHMVAYVYPSSPVSWANSNTDPRFDFVNPRGVAVVLADLNGRWAVPGTSYGQAIEKVARAINAR